MSRLFDDGSSEYLSVDSAPLTAYPLTMSLWFYSDSASAIQWALWVGDKDVGDESMSMAVGGWLAGDPVVVRAFRSGVSDDVVSTSGYSINTWHHACGVFADATDRAAFIDGGSKGTTNTDITIGATYDRTTIGRFDGSSPNYYMSGRIADAAIWNVALTDAEVALLATGYSPLFIRPQNLVFYAPQIRDNDEDIIGGLSLTAFNTPAIASHPPIIYPAPPFLSFPIAAGGVEVEVPAATITLTGYAPTITTTANVEIDVPLATITLTGYAPTVTVTGSVNVDVPLATITLTGYAPGIVAGLPAGRYSPGHENCIVGFTEGLKVKVEVDYGVAPDPHVKFVGRIAAIRPTSGAFENPTTEVEVHDWMGQLADQEIGIIPVQQTKRADEALTTALGSFPIQPDSWNFDTGAETFMLIFDTESPKSSMASFFQKM